MNMFVNRVIFRSQRQAFRSFSTTAIVKSHIGSSPVFISNDVQLQEDTMLIPRVIPKGAKSIKLSRLLTVKGPKGVVNLELPDFVKIDRKDTKINVNVANPGSKLQKSLWGTSRSLVNNAVVGVTEGHMSVLRFKGTGYRVLVKKEDDGKEWVKMKIGKCDMQGLPIPRGIKCSTPTSTLLVLEGCNKQSLNQFAGRLRNMHPPEPYKGKGIYMNGETIKLKARKVK